MVILISTRKNALSFLSLLCLLFNKIQEKGKIGSAWKWGGVGREGGGREEK
jgi:hypothetical protein